MKCNLSSPLMFSVVLVKAMVEELIVNPLLSNPGDYLFRTHLRGGGELNVREGLLFNLAMTKVSVLYKEPECKVEKVIKLEVM